MSTNVEHHDFERRDAKLALVKGYPSFAESITSDSAFAIYKRFDRLSARNLLYLQSELASLEAKQDAFDREDVEATAAARNSRRDWDLFQKRASDEADTYHAGDVERMRLVEEINRKLQQYSQYASYCDGRS